MISRFMATVRGLRAAPPAPLSPIIAAGLVIIGTRMLAGYTSYHRDQLAQQVADLGALGAHLQHLRASMGPLPEPGDLYPARDDVDPLDRAGEDDPR